MSLITGEFWITENAYCVQCDENSDFNHEGYAQQHALSLALGELGADSEDPTEKDFREALEEYLEEAEIEHDGELYEMADKAVAHLAENYPERKCELSLLFEAAFGKGDTRTWACMTQGWQTVHKHKVCTWNLTRKDWRNIRDGLLELIGEQLDEEHDSLEDEEFEVFIASTGNRIYFSYSELNDDGFFPSGVSTILPPSERNDQVRKMDMEHMPACYNQKQGD